MDVTHFNLSIICFSSSSLQICLVRGGAGASPVIPAEFWRFPDVAITADVAARYESFPTPTVVCEHLTERIEAALKTKVAHVICGGLAETPRFGMHPVVKSILICCEVANHSSIPNECEQWSSLQWITPKAIREKWVSCQNSFTPEVLLFESQLHALDIKYEDVIKSASKCSSFWASDRLDGACRHWEYAPGVFVIPILSNTIMPFTTTNLVIIIDKISRECLIVDPGASKEGTAHLRAVLQKLPSVPKIVLTHHHHDHVDGLTVALEVFPSAPIYAQQRTFDRIGHLLPVSSSINKHLISDENTQIITIGSASVQLKPLPGHTDGHLVLWLPESRCLLAGDHIVGYGSAVLDPDGGGNMIQYLQSTRALIELQPRVAIPAHGHPVISNPTKLLEQYIQHRILREEAILAAWKQGFHSLDELFSAVYKDTPEPLKNAAKRNISLHLQKLREEGKLI